MTAMEIALLVLGAVLFAASFVIPEMRASKNDMTVSKDEMKKMLDEELKNAREQMEDTVKETVSNAVEQSDRSLERVSNEKIMALNEYSDSVLEEIGKNHKEAIFLYDMLNDKETDLKNVVRKAEQVKADVEKMQNALADMEPARLPTDTVMEDMPILAGPVTDTAEMEEAGDKLAEMTGKNRNEQILSLHRQGESDVLIAKELGLGVGEVRLVIGLFEGVSG